MKYQLTNFNMAAILFILGKKLELGYVGFCALYSIIEIFNCFYFIIKLNLLKYLTLKLNRIDD